MKSFVFDVIKFLTPLLILFFPLYFLLQYSGENYTSIDKVIQSDKDYLIGYSYNQNNYRYIKWKKVAESERYDIWALGSSRVLQFREEMFKKSFYNVGYTITSISDFKVFLESTEEKKLPNLLIIGLDQWMFNESWDNLEEKKNKYYWQNSFTEKPKVTTFKMFTEDLIKGKYTLSELLEKKDKNNRKKIGLQAKKNIGLRNDGSFYYGKQIKEYLLKDSIDEASFNKTVKRINNGETRFSYGDTVSEKSLEELTSLLAYCKEKKIDVIGLLPPFAPSVNKAFSTTQKHNYVFDIYPNINEIFKSFEFELFDFTSDEDLMVDEEFIDGFHGGEMTYSKMLLKIAQSDSFEKEYLNINKLATDTLNKKNRYQIYD